MDRPYFRPSNETRQIRSIYNSYKKNASMNRIPGYTEVRWYSLFKLIKAMKILKQYIEEYYQIENL